MPKVHSWQASLCLLIACVHLSQAEQSSPLKLSGKAKPGFSLIDPKDSGVDFANQINEEDSAKNRTLHNGSGVAAGDFDGDGLPDLYFCSLQGHNRLYRNLGGFKFEDVTAKAGVECFGYVCRGAAFADVNSDGHSDLLVGTSGEGVLVFLNNGKGGFTDATAAAGTKTRFATVTVALADIDGDGDLDLYACNNRVEDFRDKGQANLIKVEGKLTVPDFLKDRFLLDEKGNIQEYGEPDQLYLNDGKGHFSPVSWTDGSFVNEDGKALTGPPLDWGLTAQFRDMNGDGAPDIYVCNDYWTPDRIWMNDGRGHFNAMDRLALRNTSASSMGVDFADINRDGTPDFFVVDMLSRDHQRRKMQMGAMKPTPVAIGLIENRPQLMRNTLQLNRGDGTFAEIAYHAGVAASEWSWQPIFLDVDLDGYEDVLITTGHFRDVQDADTTNKIKELQAQKKLVPDSLSDLTSLGAPNHQQSFAAELLQMSKMRPRLDTPVVAFRNNHDLTFSDLTNDWGTGQNGIHHGFAAADLDGDGDMDLIVNNLAGIAGVYRNDGNAARVAVRLAGSPGNPNGIGARVALLNGAVPLQSQEIIAGGRYLSGSQPQLCFAAGNVPSGMTLEVLWRDGSKSVISNVQANRLYVADQRDSTAVKKPAADTETKPLFADASASLQHTHHENAFDDFERQLLLPNRLSQLGPGLAWADVNGDGSEDLLIGSGKDGSLAAFAGDGRGHFAPLAIEALGSPAKRDLGSVLVANPAQGRADVLVATSNFEDGKAEGPAVLDVELNGTKAKPTAELPQKGSDSSSGAMALADINGDGELDLFVGGRSVPGRYPQAASSRIFLRKGSSWILDEKNSTKLAGIGLVSGAVFSDLNGDGWPDLVMAVEWGPVTVFLNDGHGALIPSTDKLGLAPRTGWWTAVTTGDFDGDGRMDIVATNWGRNSKYEHHYDEGHPLLIYWGDFNGDGITQIVESHFDHAMHKLVPERGLSCSSTAMPFIRKIAPTYERFGGSGLQDLYGEKLASAPSLSAKTLDHVLFLNRGDHFDPTPLPVEAQLTPSLGLTAADFDGDGREDLFLAQNFFAAQIETPRIDAGRGLLLLGDGKGGFKPASARESGIRVDGDARGAAACDFDHDGRVDLAVGQNGAATKLFRNENATPGVRVVLRGPDGNVAALGAQIRVVSKAQKGPIREIHGGSGYWSQDASVQVLAPGADASAIWVRWPGGRETTAPLASGVREVTVRADGSVAGR